MSYFETIQGAGKPGFTEGMGASFTVGAGTPPNGDMLALQQDLQRLGFLAAGTGMAGATSGWSLGTASALMKAKTSLGWTGTPFTMTNGGRLVTIPDDLIAAIHAAAAPAAAASPTPLPLPTPIPSGPDPSMYPASLPPTSTPVPPLVEEATSSRTRLYLIGGGVAVVGVAAIAFVLWPRKVTANRRRHRRR